MRILKGFLVVVFMLVVSGCAGWQEKGRPVVRTITDIAGDLCNVIAAEQLEIDKDALGGLSIEQWCAIEENAANILNIIFSAKQEAEQKAGFKPVDEDG